MKLSKNLSLNRETLRVLSGRSAEVNGGTGTNTGYTTEACETILSLYLTCEVCYTNNDASVCRGCGSGSLSMSPSRCNCAL